MFYAVEVGSLNSCYHSIPYGRSSILLCTRIRRSTHAYHIKILYMYTMKSTNIVNHTSYRWAAGCKNPSYNPGECSDTCLAVRQTARTTGACRSNHGFLYRSQTLQTEIRKSHYGFLIRFCCWVRIRDVKAIRTDPLDLNRVFWRYLSNYGSTLDLKL